MDLYYRGRYDGDIFLISVWSVPNTIEGWQIKACRLATMLEF